jgi:hypothetical protein
VFTNLDSPHTPPGMSECEALAITIQDLQDELQAATDPSERQRLRRLLGRARARARLLHCPIA